MNVMFCIWRIVVIVDYNEANCKLNLSSSIIKPPLYYLMITSLHTPVVSFVWEQSQTAPYITFIRLHLCD
jgi:hypothetical protein